MDNVQKHNICTNVPSSETFTSNLHIKANPHGVMVTYKGSFIVLDFYTLFFTTASALITNSKVCLGRAIAQAVSRWLPIAAAWVRARVWSSGICGGQSGAGASFLRVLRFPLPSS
jgi:hypothetical protein